MQRATRKLVSSGNFNLLMKDVLAICVEAVGATGGTLYIHDALTKRLRFQHVLPATVERKLPPDIADDYGMAGEAFTTRKTVILQLPEKPGRERTPFELNTGVTVYTMIATPLMMEDELPIGVVQLLNKREGIFTETDGAVLDTIGAVSTMAFMNYRLTEESVRASSLLGMGKVSHDISNLAASLFANLNFGDEAIRRMREHIGNEQEACRMYVDALESTLDDLRTSADGIVGYSRLISDISAGRPLRPNMRIAPMADTIRTAAQYLESEARSDGVEMVYEIDENAPPTLHDELYINRVVQNLVGNALKAVKEDPNRTDEKVVVRYRFSDDTHVIEVSDTGPGMTPHTIERILSGNARSQWERASGSGWGTKIVLELAAAHDATLSIDSEEGKGSTFRVAIPQRS